MRKNNSKTAALLTSALMCGAGFAGPEGGAKDIVAPLAPEPRDWCDAFDVLGTPVIKDDNPILQELKFFGRVQWQYASADGDIAGADFDDTFTEWRRVRFGAQAKMFNFLKLKANINLVDDDRPTGGDTDFGYQSFDELKATADLTKFFGNTGLDALTLTYGRHKFDFSEEAHESSKKIKTIERSAIANKVYPGGRPTGFTVDATKGAWLYRFGLFGEADPETIGGFDDGLTYWTSIRYEATESAEYLLDMVYNDGDLKTDGDFLGHDWALSLAGIYDFGRWEFMWNAIYGDNGSDGDRGAGRGGDFYGLVLMPSFWIVEDSLEGVFRYQYAGADGAEGIRLNSRYLRRDFDGASVTSGRGDEHHSFYAGLNWYICDHNLKLMTGVEYDTIDTVAGDLDAWTYFLGGRTYF